MRERRAELTSAPATARGRTLLVCGTAPAVLVAVALVQALLSQAEDLTPWKGGGFAMFASVDRAEHRAVRVYLRTPDGEVPAVLTDPDSDEDTTDARVVRARNLPTDGALESLAASLAAQQWTLEDEDGTRVAVTREAEAASSDALTGEAGATDPAETDDAPPGPPLQVEAVRVEVWRLGFEPGSARVVPTQLADVVEEVR